MLSGVNGSWMEVSYGESRKITNDGKYVGWKAGCNFKHDEAKVAITYMF